MIIVLRDQSSKYRRPDRYEPHVAKGTGQVTRVWGHMCPLGPGPSSHVNHGGVKATGGVGEGGNLAGFRGDGNIIAVGATMFLSGVGITHGTVIRTQMSVCYPGVSLVL